MSQNALKHIEITTGINVYHSFLCGRMDANTDGTGRAEEKWLLSNLKSTQAATWTDLLKHLKEKGMYDVANDIEHLFTNRSLVSTIVQSEVHELPKAAFTRASLVHVRQAGNNL